MHAERLQVVILALLLLAGCSGNSTSSGSNQMASCVPSPEPSFAYVLNNQNTVFSYSLNSCTGALTPINPATTATNGNEFGSESIAVDPSGKFAYVANLMSNAADLATISMYTIDSSTGVLTPTSPQTVPTGYFPQGIAIDPSGRFVYTANSDDNTVSMFTVNQSTGVLMPTTPPTVAAGLSPGSVTIAPSGRFAYVSNQNGISMYAIDSSTGVLTPLNPASVPGGSGFGVTVDPTGKFAYAPDNITNFVAEFTVDANTGVLAPTAERAIPTQMEPTNVAIDPSSKFAYIVNRQSNSVSACLIDQNSGDLSLIGTVPTGTQPWRAAVDLSGKFVYVGNENTGTVSIYSINRDGSLKYAGLTSIHGEAFDISIISPK